MIATSKWVKTAGSSWEISGRDMLCESVNAHATTRLLQCCCFAKLFENGLLFGILHLNGLV